MDYSTQRSMTEPALKRTADNQPGRAASPEPDSQPTLFDVLHVLIAAQHADSALYGGLLACSRAARDWVLTTAPQATLTLRPPVICNPMNEWQVQLAAVQRALATRGGLPTRVVLALSHTSEDASVNLIPGALQGALGVADVSIPFIEYDKPALTALVQGLAAALPSLRTLKLECPCHLPPPSLAPQLSSLSIRVTQGCFQAQVVELGHVAQYLCQLVSLAVTFGNSRYAPNGGVAWSRLFTHPTQSLTKLSTNTTLYEALLDAILSHSPCLQELR